MDIFIYLLLEGILEIIAFTFKPKKTSKFVNVLVLILLTGTMMFFLALSYLDKQNREKMWIFLILAGFTAYTAIDFYKEKKTQNN